MAKETTTPTGTEEAAAAGAAAPAAGAAATATEEKPGEKAVPYDRFKQVNDERQALKDKAEKLEKWKEEQEAKSLSELEKAQKAAEKLQSERDEAVSKATALERSQWIRTAAQREGFHDPQDAVLHLGTEVESEDDAAKKVKDLAESKKHLLMGAAERQSLGSLLGSATGTEDVPIGADGKPDERAGLGRDLLKNLVGR